MGQGEIVLSRLVDWSVWRSWREGHLCAAREAYLAMRRSCWPRDCPGQDVGRNRVSGKSVAGCCNWPARQKHEFAADNVDGHPFPWVHENWQGVLAIELDIAIGRNNRAAPVDIPAAAVSVESLSIDDASG